MNLNLDRTEHIESINLIAELARYQDKVLELCKNNPEDFDKQFHTDLSPLGWHLGHCVYTEIYWIREQLLSRTVEDHTELMSLYVPELALKKERGKKLPSFDELFYWSEKTQQENLELLSRYQQTQQFQEHHLLQNNFLLHFLIQHYSQHFETMNMVLNQRTLKQETDYQAQTILKGKSLNKSNACLPAGNYTIGSETDFLPYDNEYPPHQFETDDVAIANRPVTNSEYLMFMEDGAYASREYWSDKGWEWQQEYKISKPEFWRQDDNLHWYGVDVDGAHELEADNPVYGVSHYEAMAFANWTTANQNKARLIHEYEWEAANKNNVLNNTNQVWEWCSNHFHPYEGFKAFPYEGYSAPYFDQSHFVMKGASKYTCEKIKRSSFRNYYQADKRYQFAGFRLVFE